jgi:ADP-ribose pyrophosphatase YjhB (NUDIX family)
MVIRPGVAAVIFDGERVLLQRRDDNGKWGLPGGSVEPGESVRTAVVREVHEETGLDVEPVRLIGVYSDPANHQVITYPDGNVIHYVSTVFECAIRGGTLTCGCESLDLAFFPTDRLPPDTLPISRIRIADALARQVEAFVR